MLKVEDAIEAVKKAPTVYVAFTIEVLPDGSPTKTGFLPAAKKYIHRMLKDLEPGALTSGRISWTNNRDVIFDERAYSDLEGKAIEERLSR